MDARPFKLLNASECAWLADSARVAAAGWLADWLPATGLRSVRVQDAHAAAPAPVAEPDGWCTWAAPETTAGSVSMRFAGDAERALVGHLLGPGHEGALGRELARRAGSALAAALLGGLPSAVGSGRPGAPSPDGWRRGSGAAHLVIEAGSLALSVVADAAWVRSRLDVRPKVAAASRRPLASRRDAIGAARVRIQAFAGAVQLDIRTLQSLVPGDVLRLDRRLDQALALTVDGREADVRTYLGAQAGQRAVQLAASR